MMGLFKSVTKAISKVASPSNLLNTLTGGIQNAGTSAIANLTGLSGSGSSLLGNIVQGAVGLGTDYLQSQYNLSQQKKLASHTAQEQNLLNEAAYQRNLQQWNLENAYNSPAEQMKRFEAAGLNKNLIYGQQNTAANSPTLQPATYNAGQYHPVDKSAQRQALTLALLEHSQRIENQAIENDLARQRLVLAQRDSDRSDALAKAQIDNMYSLLGMREHPLSPYIGEVGSVVNSYKGPISRLADKLVDKFYPTEHKPNIRGPIKTYGTVKYYY